MTESEAEAASGALLSRAKQGRERILGAIREAAIAEFSRHGFKGASTKAIAELHRTGGRYALVTMCIGGGQGIAAIFERV